MSPSLYKKSRGPFGQFNVDRIEQLVEEKLTEMVNRQGFLEDLSASINVETEGETGSLLEEKRGLERELREIHEQIDTYIELIGLKGSTILPLIEEKIGKLQAEEKRITKRRDELVLQLEYCPQGDRCLGRPIEHLKDFTQVMALATSEEKAQILQLILKNVEGERCIAHPQHF